jgi:hypothetical protein
VSNKINKYKKENKKMEDIKKEENKIKISEAEIEKFKIKILGEEDQEEIPFYLF